MSIEYDRDAEFARLAASLQVGSFFTPPIDAGRVACHSVATSRDGRRYYCRYETVDHPQAHADQGCIWIDIEGD